MPSGTPKAGFRRPKGARQAEMLQKLQAKFGVPVTPVGPQAAAVLPAVQETDEQISARLQERFEVLADMTAAAIEGDCRALIVSGPAGLGKSYTVEQALAEWDPNADRHMILKGYVRAPALFKLLYSHRRAGSVLVFDDADEVFLDDTAITLLKAACDSTETRKITYMTEATLIDDEGEPMPKTFEFDGTVIFITNYDFDAMIERGSKLAPHLQALVSRAHYIDLAMKTRRDYVIRIRQVVAMGLLTNIGLDRTGQDEVVAFIEGNADRLRELSLRMALKLGAIRRRFGQKWERTARTTCFRGIA